MNDEGKANEQHPLQVFERPCFGSPQDWVCCRQGLLCSIGHIQCIGLGV